MNVIGTCSQCGGPVAVPTVWMGIYPPNPTCQRCGAVASQYGPTIPTVPVDKKVVTSTTLIKSIEELENGGGIVKELPEVGE